MPPPTTEFKSVDRFQLQRAFAIAHRGAESPHVNEQGRKRLRQIAKIIWESCSEDGVYRNPLSPDIELALSLLCGEARP